MADIEYRITTTLPINVVVGADAASATICWSYQIKKCLDKRRCKSISHYGNECINIPITPNTDCYQKTISGETTWNGITINYVITQKGSDFEEYTDYTLISVNDKSYNGEIIDFGERYCGEEIEESLNYSYSGITHKCTGDTPIEETYSAITVFLDCSVNSINQERNGTVTILGTEIYYKYTCKECGGVSCEPETTLELISVSPSVIPCELSGVPIPIGVTYYSVYTDEYCNKEKTRKEYFGLQNFDDNSGCTVSKQVTIEIENVEGDIPLKVTFTQLGGCGVNCAAINEYFCSTNVEVYYWDDILKQWILNGKIPRDGGWFKLVFDVEYFDSNNVKIDSATTYSYGRRGDIDVSNDTSSNWDSKFTYYKTQGYVQPICDQDVNGTYVILSSDLGEEHANSLPRDNGCDVISYSLKTESCIDTSKFFCIPPSSVNVYSWDNFLNQWIASNTIKKHHWYKVVYDIDIYDSNRNKESTIYSYGRRGDIDTTNSSGIACEWNGAYTFYKTQDCVLSGECGELVNGELEISGTSFGISDAKPLNEGCNLVQYTYVIACEGNYCIENIHWYKWGEYESCDCDDLVLDGETIENTEPSENVWVEITPTSNQPIGWYKAVFDVKFYDSNDNEIKEQTIYSYGRRGDIDTTNSSGITCEWNGAYTFYKTQFYYDPNGSNDPLVFNGEDFGYPESLPKGNSDECHIINIFGNKMSN